MDIRPAGLGADSSSTPVALPRLWLLRRLATCAPTGFRRRGAPLARGEPLLSEPEFVRSGPQRPRHRVPGLCSVDQGKPIRSVS